MAEPAPRPARPSASAQARPGAVDLAARLLNPAVVDLARDRVDPDDPADPAGGTGAMADQVTRHALEVERLRARHADLLRSGRPAQARRALAALIDHERRRRQLVEATTRTSAPVPSLLDRVMDAIESSSGTGGRTRSYGQRSPIGLGAAALVADIEAVVGGGPRTQLPRRTWGWAVRHAADPRTAETLTGWLDRALAAVEPSRPVDLAAPCPACGQRFAWLPDDTGQVVRTAALRVDRDSGWARCVARPLGNACRASWSPGQLTLLAQVIEQQRLAAEREAADRADAARAVMRVARVGAVSA